MTETVADWERRLGNCDPQPGREEWLEHCVNVTAYAPAMSNDPAAALVVAMIIAFFVTDPIIDRHSDRIVGVRCKDGREFRAPFVVAADGNSSRLGLAMGLTKRDDRPMGVAVRTYVESPRDREPYLDSWLELWDEVKSPE